MNSAFRAMMSDLRGNGQLRSPRGLVDHPLAKTGERTADAVAATGLAEEAGGDRPHSVSVVVPIYRGQETIGELVAELDLLTRPIATPSGGTFRVDEIILVHDHGPDLSDVVLQELQQAYEQVRVIWLSRNFGQDAATIAGMSIARGDWIVTMDEDGQHDPGFIGAFLDMALARRADVVYSKPTNRRPQGFLRNLTSRVGRVVLATAFGLPDFTRFESFRLIRGDIGRQLAGVAQNGIYLDIALSWVVGAIAQAPVVLRTGGRDESSYNYLRLLTVFWGVVLCSGTRVLRVVSLLGVMLGVIGCAMAAVVVYQTLIADVGPPAGWASIMVVLLLCSGAILFSLGFVAEYLGVVLHVLVGRPLYVIVDAPPPRPAVQPGNVQPHRRQRRWG